MCNDIGIDVQNELRLKTGSPNLGPTHAPQNLVQPPPISRTLLNRHHGRRSNSSIAPKLEPGISTLPPPIHAGNQSVASPKSRPTPSSHSASPTASTAFGGSPVGSEHVAPTSMRSMMPPTGMKGPPQHNQPQMGHLAGPPRMMQPMQAMSRQHPGHQGHAARMGGSSVSNAPFYQTPAYQNHIEQLGKLPRFLLPLWT